MSWWGRRVWHLSRWRTACVVLYFTDRANSLVRSLSLLLSLPLSVIMNKITPVTDWWNHDGLQGWFQWFILADHWPSVSVAMVFLLIFDLRMCDVPLQLFFQVRSSSSAGDGYTQLAGVYFWFEKEVWVGRKCAQLFFLYEPLRFEDLERRAVSCSDGIMRLLK